MNTENTTNTNEVLDALIDIRAFNESFNRRLVRIETRLTQLMVFEGMQNDGRAHLINLDKRNDN